MKTIRKNWWFAAIMMGIVVMELLLASWGEAVLTFALLVLAEVVLHLEDQIDVLHDRLWNTTDRFLVVCKQRGDMERKILNLETKIHDYETSGRDNTDDVAAQ